MKTPKKFLATRIKVTHLNAFKRKCKKEGRQQTTVVERLLKGWVDGDFEV